VSTRIVCDGCNIMLQQNSGESLATIEGFRADSLGGGELPSGDFHWCRPCAVVAFRAVKAAREAHLNTINPERQK
jgi:hypothetical protein